MTRGTTTPIKTIGDLHTYWRGEPGELASELSRHFAAFIDDDDLSSVEAMDGLSEIVYVRGERCLATSEPEWRRLEAWMESHWVDDPGFVDNSLPLIVLGHMVRLFDRITATLQASDPTLRADAEATLVWWGEEHGDPPSR